MSKLIVLLCTLFFITVKTDVPENPNSKLLQDLETKFTEFKELQKEISDKVKTDNYPERRKLWTIVDEYIESLENDVKTTNTSLESAYKDPMSSECMLSIKQWLFIYEILKSDIRTCPNNLIIPADSHLYRTSVNAKSTKKILREHLDESKTCESETCKTLLQDYYSYSNSTLVKLKQDYAKYYSMLDDTNLVKGCVEQLIDRTQFSTNTVKYTDRFKQCLSRKTNINY